jgi:subtilase family serine protease
MRLAIVLPQRNQEELSQLLEQLYDPNGPEFRQFLTVQEFTERFGPTQDDYQAVLDFAAAQGLKVVDTAANRMLVDIEGPAADIERVFHVKMSLYQLPSEERTFYSPDREPSLDLTVPVLHIAGLDNFFVPRNHRRKHQEGDAAVNHLTGSGPGGQYLGSDMRAAYYGGTALTGAGQSVGLYEYYGYESSDITAYFKGAGQTNNVPINPVLLDGVGLSCSGSCDDSEQVLDIVQAISMAPGMSQARVYIGSIDADILNKMASENIAKQLSCSWGTNVQPSVDDPIFQEFAAQGQSFADGSADNGAYTGNNNRDDGVYPADDAYITAVGGTDLITSGPGGSWVSETSWIFSGGGPSDNRITIPSWQVGVANSSNNASTTLRNVPDVAMEGDEDNYACGNGSCYGGDGGTSYSAPRWGGFLALVNQQAVADGNSTVGFINPAIYAIGEGSSFDSDFHDIISGNNDCCRQKTWWNAVTGFDLVTGWGSPNGQNMINALTEVTVGCTPTPIVPYIQVSGGRLQQTASAKAGSVTTVVNLAPQPASGGTWSWTGPNGFTSTSRLLDSIPLSVGINSYVATYTNSGGCQSTQTFTITVK